MNRRHLFAGISIMVLCVAPSAHAKRAVASKATSKAPVSESTAAAGARPSASGSSGDLGVGAIFGEPTGLTLKKWTTGAQAFDITLAYSFYSFFQIEGDYLWHFPKAMSSIIRGKVGEELVPYLGAGGALFFDNSDSNGGKGFTGRRSDVAFGLRFPVGLEFLPHGAPLGVFAEIAPGLGLAPSTFAYLEGGIGARYYF